MGLSMFIFFFPLFFFSATILSRPYLWNRYSQRLQIECAAWSCGLVLHYCLPSNSLCNFFFFFFFFAKILSVSYLWNRYSQRLQIECAAWFCGLVLHYCLPSNSLCNFFFFSFYSATILSGPYLWNRYSQRLQIECAAWSCGLILHCCLPSNSLRYWTKVQGSLLGCIQGDREPVSLELLVFLYKKFMGFSRHFIYLFSFLTLKNCRVTRFFFNKDFYVFLIIYFDLFSVIF